MKLGSLEKGWVFRVSLSKPYQYKNLGRVKNLVLFGCIHFFWIMKRKEK